MAQVVPFTSAAKKHREKLMTLSFTPTTSAQLLTTGANSQIKAYPYLSSLWLHAYCTGGSGGNLAADAPWNALQSIQVADTNGSPIYGSPNFTGYDAYLVNLLAGLRNMTDATLMPFYSATAGAFEWAIRVPFEYNQRTGAGCLPNMSANATYNLQLYGNTLANIWQTAPTTTPSVSVDVWMECYTLPDAQDLLGRHQMQGPPLLGTTQYVTKQTYPTVISSSNNVALTRKGNMIRKWLIVTRNSVGARTAAFSAAGSGPGGGALPNPFEFWWDGNRLTSDDPKFLAQKTVEELGPLLQSSSLEVLPTGVIDYDWSAPYGINYGGDGEGGWLATTQSSRLELLGAAWGSSASSMDVITIDVAPIALANQYALDSNTGKLMFPAQPEYRG